MDTPDYANNTNFILNYGNIKINNHTGILKNWKTKYFVLSVCSSLGHACLIQYKDNHEFEKNRGSELWYLKNMKEIIQNPKEKFSINIVMKDGQSLTLKFETGEESSSWLHSLCDIKQLEESRNLKGTCTYYVKLETGNTETRFRGECCMIIDRNEVILKSHNGVLITIWPFNVIRRYKPEDGATFTVEVGRASRTGEGIFRFMSFQTSDILQQLDSYMGIQVSDSARGRKSSVTSQISKSSSSSSNPVPSGGYLTPINRK